MVLLLQQCKDDKILGLFLERMNSSNDLFLCLRYDKFCHRALGRISDEFDRGGQERLD